MQNPKVSESSPTRTSTPREAKFRAGVGVRMMPALDAVDSGSHMHGHLVCRGLNNYQYHFEVIGSYSGPYSRFGSNRIQCQFGDSARSTQDHRFRQSSGRKQWTSLVLHFVFVSEAPAPVGVFMAPTAMMFMLVKVHTLSQKRMQDAA